MTATATIDEDTNMGAALDEEAAARAEAEALAEATAAGDDMGTAGDDMGTASGETVAIAAPAAETDAYATSADETATALDDAPTPIGVMDPSAYENGVGSEIERQAWEEPVEQGPVSTGSGFSSTAAVRLLRTVAPWTAPSANDKGADEAD